MSVNRNVTVPVGSERPVSFVVVAVTRPASRRSPSPSTSAVVLFRSRAEPRREGPSDAKGKPRPLKQEPLGVPGGKGQGADRACRRSTDASRSPRSRTASSPNHSPDPSRAMISPSRVTWTVPSTMTNRPFAGSPCRTSVRPAGTSISVDAAASAARSAAVASANSGTARSIASREPATVIERASNVRGHVSRVGIVRRRARVRQPRPQARRRRVR